MKLLYLDTNIFLNVLLEENPFVESSYKLLSLIEEGKFSAITSFLTIMEIYRILQKQNKNEEKIEKAIHEISSSAVEIILQDSSDLLYAYQLIKRFKIDPADSIHLSIAMQRKAVFITRDEVLAKRIKNISETNIPEKFI